MKSGPCTSIGRFRVYLVPLVQRAEPFLQKMILIYLKMGMYAEFISCEWFRTWTRFDTEAQGLLTLAWL